MSTKQDGKAGMPDTLWEAGDGRLVAFEPKEAPPEETEPAQPPKEKKPKRALKTVPEPVGGKVETPSGGNVKNPTGGDKPSSIAQELSESLPMVPSERGPTPKKEESGTAVVSKKLAPQLGTAPEFLSRQQIDERKLAVLNEYTATSYNYLAFRGYVDEIRFWQWFVDSELVTSQAINGLARQHILKAIAASSGVHVSEVAQRPNIAARNLWSRNWQRDAARQGKTVMEE